MTKNYCEMTPKQIERVRLLRAERERARARLEKETQKEKAERLKVAITRHAKQRFTPVERLHVLANVRASMETPCDTGLPWLPPLGEAFMEHLIYLEGLGIELKTVEANWRDAVYAQRKYVQDTIRKAFCKPTQTLWEGLGQFGHDLINMHNRPDLSNAAFRTSVRAAMLDAWARYQRGERSGYYHDQDRRQKNYHDKIAGGAQT